jgi:hypothetical protein
MKGKKMNRRILDTLMAAGGLVIAGVLVVAGFLGLWGHRFANENVKSQLVAQQVYFPAKGSPELADPKIAPYLSRYAGQQMTTGAQAKAYADHFIAVHLSEMPYGGVYSKISAAAMAAKPGSADATKLTALKTSSFQGTTLRGLLLEAYAFATIGQIMLIGAIASFILAAMMAVLVAFGFAHAARTSEDARVLAPKAVPAAS